MTNDTCTRCGERPAVPGECGRRCMPCINDLVAERVGEL